MRISIHHFVVTSVRAHAAIFAAWSGTTSRPLMMPATEASAPTLHVAFQAERAVVRKHPIRPTPRPQKVRQPHKHKPIPRPQIARTRQTSTPEPVTHHNNPAVNKVESAYQAQLRRKAIRSHVLSQIRTDLRQYFVYPLLAQRRGWQGRVVLAFSVTTNGMIHNIRVASGSGYPILDSSAVDALSRVHQLYPHNTGLSGQSMQLQLPVIFELQGG
ncbi:MAG: energy transducer TonB [Gammaproteobacteria bacterium]